MNGEMGLALVAGFALGALAVRLTWPVVEEKEVVRYVDPQRLDERAQVVYLAFDPAKGEVVYGPEGVVLDSKWVVELQTKVGDGWHGQSHAVSDVRYRISFSRNAAVYRSDLLPSFESKGGA